MVFGNIYHANKTKIMCGINGFNFNQPDLIRQMNKRIGHRGPDFEDVYLTDDFSLGHVRLSIIDLSEKAKQPMFNEDKSLALVFNGEIYNYRELKNDLEKRGHRFLSQSDSEIILHLYEDLGVDCLKKLNGMFAFAVLNINKGEVFLARDRIGIKPLYYYFSRSAGKNGGAKFIFSSEIKGILEHNIEREISMEAFNHYFRLHYIPHPYTIFKNIYKIPPASYLLLKNNQLIIKKYWRINDYSDLESEDEIIEKIQYLMEDSVRRQLISDRPLGLFLSGGVDSTSILGTMRQLGHQKIKTFSVGFDFDSDYYNIDFNLAKKISRHYQTDHHEFLVSGRDMLKNIEKVVYQMDEPIANATQIVTYLLSKYTRQEVAVVLGGDGGDELFGGYKRYAYSQLAGKWQLIPLFLRKNIIAKMLIDSSGKYLGKGDLLDKLNVPPGAEKYLMFMSQKDNVLKEVLKENYFEKDLTKEFFQDKYFDKFSGDDFEKYFMLVDLQSWLVDESLMRTDKMTMAFGLEERVPILDHRLVELSAKIPSCLKLKSGGKHIFKKAMGEHLPDYVVNAPKRGWFSPVAKWLRTDLKDFAYQVLSESYCPKTNDYFDFKGIRNILDDHIEKKRYNLTALLVLITWQVWARQYLSRQ